MQFSDGSSDMELRLQLGGIDISGPRDIYVDANDTSLAIQLKHSGSLMTLMETDSLFDRIKSAETIWLVVLCVYVLDNNSLDLPVAQVRTLVLDRYLDDDQLVINLKKQNPELKWPDIVESWESLAAGSMQLLRGTSIYIVGDSTEINQKVAKELAVGLGYYYIVSSFLGFWKRICQISTFLISPVQPDLDPKERKKSLKIPMKTEVRKIKTTYSRFKSFGINYSLMICRIKHY